ncbi:IS3 family transposase [Porphyromonas gingivalis]|nr:IS3 family transposase [Porphyromonas gingivalis]EOA09581.1 ISPg5, transposase Orf1 [Porphyromonas gingivalis JCVI SC001]MCE8179271.1 IS3 family transposase [Porphyromonas gingivalis]PDP55581.1 IS3 family transposase [Porphyromonas gingivalis]RZQ66260.1 IS3 family transposase [Porphyromonas gingivalis]
MSKHLTDSERLHIVKEYLGSTRSKYAIEKKYNIAQGLIKDWLRKFWPEDKILLEQTMKATPHPKSDLTPGEKEELEQLRKEVRLLKTKLKRENLGHEAYKLMVELAEETYGIEIRKNSEAK